MPKQTGIIIQLSWLKKQTVSYCFTLLYLPDTFATFQAPNNVLGTFFSIENSLLIFYQSYEDINISKITLLPH